MAQLYFSLFDDRRAIRTSVDSDIAASLLAALSADPETIAEFERAMHRFFHPDFARTVRAAWTESTETIRMQPDRESLSVDLPGRLIVFRHDPIEKRDHVSFFDENGCAAGRFGYHLSSQWMLTRSDVDQRQLALSRRDQRRTDRRDVRHVLFGDPMIQFLADQAQQAFVDERPTLPGDWSEQRHYGRFRRGNEVYGLARRIHRDWLMSDLGGRCLRNVMLEDHEHIVADISYRATQWSQQGACPPGLNRSDAAFVWGDMGEHEIILYYDLIRELLLSYFEHAIKHTGVPNGVRWLTKRRDQWMETPQADLTGLTPHAAIERERLRTPLVDPDHGVIDDDCPVCRMTAELGLGPTFVQLSDFHFDDEFAFSMHAREEEWATEQVAFNGDYEPSERSPDVEGDPRDSTDAIWQRVYVNQDMLGRSINEDVMAIAFFLAELVEDLRGHHANDDLVNQLNRHFDYLPPASRETHSLLPPALSRLGETIDDVAQQCPDLAEKCLDLQNHLARMSQMLEQ